MPLLFAAVAGAPPSINQHQILNYTTATPPVSNFLEIHSIRFKNYG
jgi:hypothetical protein